VAATKGVSGLAVGLVTVGGILLAAAITNRQPVDIVKTILKKPTSGKPIGPALSSTTSGVATSQALGRAVGSGGSASAGSGSAGSSSALVVEARRHLGAKYVFGAAGPNTFDCSGLVVYCLRKTLIPDCKRFYTGTVSSYLKGKGWRRVEPSQFAAGDVIIKSGHMGIAISNSRMIHAPHTGSVVKEADIFDKGSWWGYRWQATDQDIKNANDRISKGGGLL
jgi:cell wall-associated NlpC family hydrolase